MPITRRKAKIKRRQLAPAPRPTPPQRAVQSPVPPEQALPMTTAIGDNKENSKGKGKGKCTDVPLGVDECDNEEDDVVVGEMVQGQESFAPALQSVTAYLSSTPGPFPVSTITGRHSHPSNPHANASFSVAATKELINTAKILYKNTDVQDGIADDDEYWASFPPHIRNFVGTVYSQQPASRGDEKKAQAMYAIAQQMVQSEAAKNRPAPTPTATNMTRRGAHSIMGVAYPSVGALPFDPSYFADPAFNRSIQEAAAALAPSPLPAFPGNHPHGPLPATNVVLLNEIGGDEQLEEYDENEYLSEDFEDEDERSEPPQLQPQGIIYTPASTNTHPNATDTNTIEKNKEGQTTFPSSADRPALPGNVAPKFQPPTRPSANQAQPPAISPVVRPDKYFSASPPAMPVARTTPAAQPPPSSVSIGKKPMAYPPPNPGASPQAQPQSRSARAASKAPLPAHAYPHNHTHHHPSPPSSNASAPHKPRPPAVSANPPPPAPPKANKIWSTSTTEERERIKDFWLGLGEEERRSLVKIEKDTVLRKMKEQQKHSCSCAVCGRKRFVVPFSSPFDLKLIFRISIMF